MFIDIFLKNGSLVLIRITQNVKHNTRTFAMGKNQRGTEFIFS